MYSMKNIRISSDIHVLRCEINEYKILLLLLECQLTMGFHIIVLHIFYRVFVEQ